MHDMPLCIVFCMSICVCLWTTRSISNHIKSTSQLITSYLNISWLFWSNCTCIVPVSTPKSRLLHNRTKCPSHSTQIEAKNGRTNTWATDNQALPIQYDVYRIFIHRMDTERAKDSLIINRIICKIVAGSTHWNAALLPSTTFYVPVSSETKKHPWELRNWPGLSLSLQMKWPDSSMKNSRSTSFQSSSIQITPSENVSVKNAWTNITAADMYPLPCSWWLSQPSFCQK